MAERTHAELEQYHYQALNDPRYVAWLLNDEMQMAMMPPLTPYEPEGQPCIKDDKPIPQVHLHVYLSKKGFKYE